MDLELKNKSVPPIDMNHKSFFEKYLDRNAKKFIKKVKKLYDKDRISDKMFLTLMYRFRMGRWINWRNPKSFTEKLQWLKIYNRKDEYTMLVDKVKVKDFIKEKVGEKYVVPTIGVWNSPEEIEFDKLPDTFVLKCNHASSRNYIKSLPETPVDKKFIIDTLNKRFKVRWDKNSGEWPYRNVEKKILAEECLPNLAEGGKPDYKVLCFHGEPKFVQVFSYDSNYVNDYKEEIGCYNVYYDLDWNKQEFIIGYPYKNEVDISKPKNLKEMLEVARKLSEGIPFVKVDFYLVEDRIYVGELTFFPYGAFSFVMPGVDWDIEIGKLLKIK